MTHVVIILLGAMVFYLALRIDRVKYEAHEDVVLAYNSVVGLSDVARAAYDLAQADARTAVSMTGGSGNFLTERNASARAAKLRGYEVWRNQQLEPIQNRLRAAYKRYETNARALLESMDRRGAR